MPWRTAIFAILFIVVFAVHSIVQFIFWAWAARDLTALSVYGLLALPLFPLVGSLADQYFWIIASLNSLLWAVTITYIATRLFRMRDL